MFVAYGSPLLPGFRLVLAPIQVNFFVLLFKAEIVQLTIFYLIIL